MVNGMVNLRMAWLVKRGRLGWKEKTYVLEGVFSLFCDSW